MSAEISVKEKLKLLKTWFRENPNLPEEIGRSSDDAFAASDKNLYDSSSSFMFTFCMDFSSP